MSEIWTINRGSSSLKLGRYDAHTGALKSRENLEPDAPLPKGDVAAIGHRVVHGGERFFEPTRITPHVIQVLKTLIPLAPLHEPANIAAIEACEPLGVPQFACFDTAFHASQDERMRRLALPQKLREGGVQNYGFHGLNYEHVAETLGPDSGRWVVLHLGSGASACALRNGKSLGTSMGFSALEGLIMGTRPGRLDPGVVIHWLRQGIPLDELENQLYKNSGLKGLAADNDMRALLARQDEDAVFAVEAFCFSAARAVGDLSIVLGGVDGVVFTGGVGENSSAIQSRVMELVQHLTPTFRVIPADEEGVIARAVFNQLS